MDGDDHNELVPPIRFRNRAGHPHHAPTAQGAPQRVNADASTCVCLRNAREAMTYVRIRR
jgi:hypothetical protein